MNESLPESDEQIALKKRARRRLIGAIVFVSFAAVVLPMVMDEEPPPATPSIELNIPAQDKGFAPPPTGMAKPTVGIAEPVPPVAASTEVKAPVAAPSPTVKPDALPEATKPVAEVRSEPKPAVSKPVETKTAETKPAPKPAVLAKAAKPEPAKPAADAKRAQSILDGKAAEPGAGGDGQHVILIGAFANQGNVQTLQKKLGEMGLRVYTEPLDSPQGKKTRVRVGPFPSREAAEKAVARMKSIGVGGVVAAKS